MKSTQAAKTPDSHLFSFLFIVILSSPFNLFFGCKESYSFYVIERIRRYLLAKFVNKKVQIHSLMGKNLHLRIPKLYTLIIDRY